VAGIGFGRGVCRRGGSGGKVFAGGGDGEFAVFDAARGDQFIGDGFDGLGFAAHGEDFQAVMVVQMDVQRGEDEVVVVVLDIGEGCLDVLFVVVIDQGDGAGDFAVAVVLPVLDQAGADEVGDADLSGWRSLFRGSSGPAGWPGREGRRR